MLQQAKKIKCKPQIAVGLQTDRYLDISRWYQTKCNVLMSEKHYFREPALTTHLHYIYKMALPEVNILIMYF